MKSRFLATLIAIPSIIAFGPIARAETNTWSNSASGTWNWVNASNWLLGLAPNINQSAIVITNGAGVSKIESRTVTVDSTTVAQPVTMTVSNVIISAPGIAPKNAHNTLFLNNAGLTTPLHIISSLQVSDNGAVTIANSVLRMGPTPPAYRVGLLIDGTLELQSGSIISTDSVDISVGAFGSGQMTVLGGTCQAGGVIVAGSQGTQGALTLAGGTNVLGFLAISGVQGADGAVSMTDGSLNTIQTDIGEYGSGQMAISGGTWLAGNVNVGTWHDASFGTASGTLTVSGGTIVINGPGSLLNDFNIAYDLLTTGAVWMTGGQLITTNTSTFIGAGPFSFGRMVISNGTWQARDVTIGYGGSGGQSTGALHLDGGAATISSNLVLGDCANGSVGSVSVYRSTLAVTNASHTAVVDLEDGTITVYGSGTLIVDVLVATNPCAVVYNAGGIISYRTLLLDPNGDTDLDGLPNWWEQFYGFDPLSPFLDDGANGDPDGDGYNNWEEYLAGSDPRDPSSTPAHLTTPRYFRTILVHRSGNDVLINWTALSGTTNQMQVTSGGSGGIYSTNGFTNIGAPLLVGGSGIVTNSFIEIGGATNGPVRYYRVRQVP